MPATTTLLEAALTRPAVRCLQHKLDSIRTGGKEGKGSKFMELSHAGCGSFAECFSTSRFVASCTGRSVQPCIC